jgi:hypothetical protein
MIYLVTCEIGYCTINRVPYGFHDKGEANNQKKLHSKNHPDKPMAVKVVDYDEWLKNK